MFRLMADRRCIILQLYSVIGGIILLKYGPFLFFIYPEWCAVVFGVITSLALAQLRASYVRQIYGGIAMGVAAVAVINALSLANVSSWLDSHVCEVLIIAWS